MAQATRSTRSHHDSNEDTMDAVVNWIETNAKPITYVVVAAVVVGASVLLYRSTEQRKRERASAALYEAQAPFVQGNMEEAQSALSKVAERYSGTSSGQQALMLLAQAYYEQGKYAEGIKALEGAVGKSSTEFRANMESLIASGYEAQNDFANAASHYEKARQATPFPAAKIDYQAAQGRSLMAAGKYSEALAIWSELAQLDGNAVQSEAQIRLGEAEAALQK